MAFPLDDILLGPATFGRLHRLDGWIWHTGEEPGFTRAYAVATAKWQMTNPGSYNFRVYDRASDSRGVMLNVPYLEASGGINPASTAWAPGRYPFLERELAKAGPCPVSGCPGPYRNPTMHHLQGSFVGRTAALNAGAAPGLFDDDGRRLIEWSDGLSNRGPAPLVHSMHGHWQSNRSDCGLWMYSRLVPEVPDDMQFWKPVQEDWWTVPGVPFWDGEGTEKSFTTRERVTSVAEASDGHRLVKYGTNELLVMPRSGLVPISGTRIPAAPNYGFPPTGYTQAQLDAAKKATADKGNAQMDAWTATRPLIKP